MTEQVVFQKVNKEDAVNDILDQIIKAIEDGLLHEGDVLPTERKMAEQMAVSRPVVREALHSLRLLGIIHSVQGGANYITDDFNQCMITPLTLLFRMNRSTVTQVQQLRSSLEVESASLAAEKCTEEDAAELEWYLKKLDQEENDRERASLDRELHLKIASIADNPMIYQVLCASSVLIENMITDIRALVMQKEKSTKGIDQEHRNLVRAIMSHDTRDARRRMNEHMWTVTGYVRTIEENKRSCGEG